MRLDEPPNGKSSKTTTNRRNRLSGDCERYPGRETWYRFGDCSTNFDGPQNARAQSSSIKVRMEAWTKSDSEGQWKLTAKIRRWPANLISWQNYIGGTLPFQNGRRELDNMVLVKNILNPTLGAWHDPTFSWKDSVSYALWKSARVPFQHGLVNCSAEGYEKILYPFLFFREKRHHEKTLLQW